MYFIYLNKKKSEKVETKIKHRWNKRKSRIFLNYSFYMDTTLQKNLRLGKPVAIFFNVGTLNFSAFVLSQKIWIKKDNLDVKLTDATKT